MTKTLGRTQSRIRRPGVAGGPHVRAWLRLYAPLPLVVLLAGAFAARWALDVDEWRVMTDEMLYVKLAASIAETLSPLPELRGHSVPNYSVLYPLFLSPLVGLFDMPTAFRLAHGLNALLMASTAVPTYLMARMAVDSRLLALITAAAAAVVPWVVLSMNVMTEALAYPLFAWSAYAIAQAVARPGVARDAVALLVIALAFLTRAQLVFLAAVLPAAVVLHEFGYRAYATSVRRWPGTLLAALRASVREHWLIVAVAVVLGLLALRGSVLTALGPYIGAAEGALFPAGLVDALWDQLNHVALGIGILPFPLAAVWVVQTVIRPSSRPAHALAITIALAVSGLAVVATRFGVLFTTGVVQERYIFYMAPLFLVGAVACLEDVRRPLLALGLAAAAAVLLVVQTKYDPNPAFPAFASPVEFTFVALDFRAEQVEDLLGFYVSEAALLAVGTVLGLGAVAVMLRSRWRSRVPVVVGVAILVWCVAVTSYAAPKVRADHEDLATGNLGERPLETRDWIDEAVPGDADVAIVPSQINARGGKAHVRDTTVETGWWEVEFWNKRVNRQYVYAGSQGYAPFPEDSMVIDPRTGRLRVNEPEPDYIVVAHSNVRFAPVAEAPPVINRDWALYRMRHPYRAVWTTTGLQDDGTVATGSAHLRLYGHGRTRKVLRRVSVSLAPVAPGGEPPYRLAAPGVRLEGRAGTTRAVSFRACVPPGGRRSIRIQGPGGGLRVVNVAVADLRGPCPRGLDPSSTR